MIKTIKVKEEMNFTELMEYIIQNGVIGTFKSLGGQQFKVDRNGAFDFESYFYGFGETYEVEVEIEITESTKFDRIVNVDKYDEVYSYTNTSINKIKDENSITFYIPIDGELVKIWECDVDE